MSPLTTLKTRQSNGSPTGFWQVPEDPHEDNCPPSSGKARGTFSQSRETLLFLSPLKATSCCPVIPWLYYFDAIKPKTQITEPSTALLPSPTTSPQGTWGKLFIQLTGTYSRRGEMLSKHGWLSTCPRPTQEPDIAVMQDSISSAWRPVSSPAPSDSCRKNDLYFILSDYTKE